MERGPDPVGAALQSQGAHGAGVQKLLRKLCDAGRVQQALSALAAYLCEEGMRRPIAGWRIPVNGGTLDREIQELTLEACLRIALDYGSKGGVLVARGYVSQHSLAKAMAQHWTESARAPTPVTKAIALGLPPDELNDRICCAVLCAKKRLEDLVREGELCWESPRIDGDNTLMIPPDKLEETLRRIVKATIWAFDDPTAAQNWLLHGTASPPSDDDEKTS